MHSLNALSHKTQKHYTNINNLITGPSVCGHYSKNVTTEIVFSGIITPQVHTMWSPEKKKFLRWTLDTFECTIIYKI